MSKLKIKELIICGISLIALVVMLTNNSFAAEDLQSLLVDDNNDITTIEEDPSITSTNTDNATINANNETNNNTNNTTIPYTGVNNSVIFIIAIAGISAIYAYKKTRDYKNI